MAFLEDKKHGFIIPITYTLMSCTTHILAQFGNDLYSVSTHNFLVHNEELEGFIQSNYTAGSQYVKYTFKIEHSNIIIIPDLQGKYKALTTILGDND